MSTTHISLLVWTCSLIAAVQCLGAGAARADQSVLPSSDARATLDLSGEWEYKSDPLDVGRSEKWFDPSISYDRAIHVPGAWNAQGVAYESKALLREFEQKQLENYKQLYGLGTLGKESESAKLFSAFPGPGWYRKTVVLPADWKGKIPWLIFGGVHREAEVWINGRSAGVHRSYLAPFRIDVSSFGTAGDTLHIVARVDARRNRNTDPLMGCFDTLDFLYITWGGLFRPVTLEATDATRFGDVFVLPHPASNSAEIRVSLEGPTDQRLLIKQELFDASGSRVAASEETVNNQSSETAFSVRIENPKLWSPKSPHLYTFQLRLFAGNTLIDSRAVRFGMREFKVAEGKFLLNGKPMFLRGYGDDCIFPNSICPPADKEEMKRRLAAAREYGFNYVRHHSWVPTEEYLDAADELGMMLQPEFPFAYRWDLPTTDEAKRWTLEQWQSMIRLNRNHPSIVTWCMGNELYDSFELAPEMYQSAKRLDPTRPVIDSDGCGFKHVGRQTLDFMVVQFGEGDSIGFQDQKYRVSPGWAKPVIAHEMGYFVTLPDLAQIDLFQNGLRPYWLIQARELAVRNGVMERYPEWLAASYRLQAGCLKSNMEAARRSGLSGTSVWLFQDYPNCAEGVVDMFHRPKGLTAQDFRTFNASTVLLLDTPRRNWRAGEKMDLKLLVSRFEDKASTATLSWWLRNGQAVIDSGEQDKVHIDTDGLHDLRRLQIDAPRSERAETLTLSVQLEDAAGVISNSWKLWIFPAEGQVEAGKRLSIRGTDVLRGMYPWASEWNDNHSLTPTDLLITTNLDQSVRNYLAEGGRVLLLQPDPTFAIEKTNYRLSSWDGGGPSGTIIDRAHVALRNMPSDGWCDLQFYDLIQGSKAVFLDSLPVEVEPLVRCIDRPTRLANRAYLFEVGVGSGKLLVSGLNFEKALRSKDPAGAFLYNQLVRYALSEEFNPKAHLAISALTKD